VCRQKTAERAADAARGLNAQPHGTVPFPEKLPSVGQRR
jgi:hypothetical protein